MLPRSWLPLAAIVILAGMVRCEHLGKLSFDFDEAFCWKMISFPPGEIWHRCALDNHPPLYFYLLWAWSQVFGDSPLALRSLSVVLGLLTVVGAYVLVRHIGRGGLREKPGSGGPVSAASRPLPKGEGELAALAAAALVALSPFQIDWSQRVRMYVLGAALAVFSCWLLLKALNASRARLRDFAYYALAAAALAYTHYYGLFVLAGQLIYSVGWAVHVRGILPVASRPHPSPGYPLAGAEGDGESRPDRSALAKREDGQLHLSSIVSHRFGLLVAFILIALAYVPWLPNFLRHREQVSQLFHTSPFTWEEVAKVCYQIFAVEWNDAPPTSPIAWYAVSACFFATGLMLILGRGGLRLLALAVVATFDGAVCASIADRNIIGSRYFVFAHVLLLCGLAAVIGQAPWRLGRRAALAATIAASAWLCLAHSERRLSHSQRPGMMAAMAYLADVRKPDEPAVVCNPILQVAAAAHAVRRQPILAVGTSTMFPYFQGTAVMRDDEYVSRESVAGLHARTLWVIDAYDWGAPAWAFHVPAPWVDISEETFREWMAEDCRIVVRRCQRRGARREAQRPGAGADEVTP